MAQDSPSEEIKVASITIALITIASIWTQANTNYNMDAWPHCTDSLLG
jgi:hypothetical protein